MYILRAIQQGYPEEEGLILKEYYLREKSKIKLAYKRSSESGGNGGCGDETAQKNRFI